MPLALALVLAAPVFDAFDGHLDSLRWYVGVPKDPRDGVLEVPRDGWIVSRGIPDDKIESLEVVFEGPLEVTFHEGKEPLSSPVGAALVPPRGAGRRTLAVSRGSATVDGIPLAFDGRLLGTFRLRGVRGPVKLDEVRVAPRMAEPDPPGELERRAVHALTTPPVYREGDEAYSRARLLLWDVEVCFLVRRGPSGARPLRAPPKGCPLLGVLVSVGYGRDLAERAGAHPLAMNDWGDERRNLSPEEYREYLAREYAVFDVLMQAQRALNAALPPGRDADALVHLAAVRHSPNPHAAVALAETQGDKAALAALRKALGKEDVRRVTPDRLRDAAGAAALAVLGEAPPEWEGFRADPLSRAVTIEQAKDLVR